MESLVASISDVPARLTDNGYMSDSIGQITSEYLPDINRATSGVERDGESDKWKEVESLYPIVGSEAKLDHIDVSKLLFAVGHSPEGYAAVEVGQKDYMGRLMDYHLNPELPADLRVSDDNDRVIRQIAERSGEISGTLRLGIQDEIGDTASDKDKEYEQSVAQRKNWISGGVGTAVGVGVSFVATPWVGALVGGTTGTATSVVLESVFQDAEGNAKENAARTGGQVWQDGWDQHVAIAEDATRVAAEQYKLDSGDLGAAARESARQGYLNSRAILEGQVPGSTNG
jgi:hypothetical protein